MDLPARLAGYAAYFEQLTPDSLAQLPDWYRDDARFRDPFNDVHGLAAIRGIFEHMFQRLQSPRFSVLGWSCQRQVAMVEWHFCFDRGRAGPVEIHGVSRLQWDDDGRIVEHLDFWDPTEPVYLRVPLLKQLLQLLRRQLSVTA